MATLYHTELFNTPQKACLKPNADLHSSW